MSSLPAAANEETPRIPWIDRWARESFLRTARQLQSGRWTVRDPLGTNHFGDCGGPASPAFSTARSLSCLPRSDLKDREAAYDLDPIAVQVVDLRTYRQIAWRGLLGAAESFMEGRWTAADLTGLIRLMIRNLDQLQHLDAGLAAWSRRLLRVGFWLRRNTVRGSRKNIREHYDLGNEFFRLFLDPTLNYSAGYFEIPEDSMHRASLAKMERICRKLALRPDDHLLEIGTGWGGLALHAARNFGCRVTTTTISDEQFRLASHRVAEAGLQSQITVLNRDYRELQGRFDKLASVEMIEAVGPEFYATFFSQCGRLLADDGVMLLQAIVMNERDYPRHLRSMDFIRTYVFPGGTLPSVTALTQAAARAGRWRLLHLDDMTQHYVLTLQRWREAFLTQREAVRELGFSKSFVRMWHFYLCYCEAAFAERRIGSVQLMYAKPDARPDPLLALETESRRARQATAGAAS